MPEQLRLLKPPSTPRRPRRVLMRLMDAGIKGYAEWLCPSCDRVVEAWYEREDWPQSYREPCPWCSPEVYGLEPGDRQESCGQTHPPSSSVFTVPLSAMPILVDLRSATSESVAVAVRWRGVEGVEDGATWLSLKPSDSRDQLRARLGAALKAVDAPAEICAYVASSWGLEAHVEALLNGLMKDHKLFTHVSTGPRAESLVMQNPGTTDGLVELVQGRQLYIGGDLRVGDGASVASPPGYTLSEFAGATSTSELAEKFLTKRGEPDCAYDPEQLARLVAVQRCFARLWRQQ